MAGRETLEDRGSGGRGGRAVRSGRRPVALGALGLALVLAADASVRPAADQPLALRLARTAAGHPLRTLAGLTALALGLLPRAGIAGDRGHPLGSSIRTPIIPLPDVDGAGRPPAAARARPARPVPTPAAPRESGPRSTPPSP